MWLLFHHYIFSSGFSSWKFRLLRNTEAPPHAHGVLCGGLGQHVETNSVTAEDFLGEQLFDARLLVRFSSFNTLSFFKT